MALFEGEPAPEETEVIDIAPRRLTYPLGRFIGEDLDYLRRISTGEVAPAPTPWEGLNELLDGGLWPEPNFIIGKPGTGKTQLALQLAFETATRGGPVLYVSLEIPRAQAVARLAALETGGSWSALYRGLDKDAIQRALTKQSKLERLPFHLSTQDEKGWPYSRISQAATEIADLYPGERIMVVIDFIQILNGDRDHKHISEVMGAAGQQMIWVCNNLDASVVALSATSRTYYGHCDERDRNTKAQGMLDPIGSGHPGWLMGVGKESGSIEYAAANQIVMCNDANGDSWLALAKQRAGRAGWCKLDFDGLRFTDAKET